MFCWLSSGGVGLKVEVVDEEGDAAGWGDEDELVIDEGEVVCV